MKKFFWWPKYLPWLLVSGAVYMLMLAWLTIEPAVDDVPVVTEHICTPKSLPDRLRTADVVMTGQVFLVVPKDNLAEVVINPIQLYRGEISTPSISLLARPVGSESGAGGRGQAELHFDSAQPPFLLFLHRRTDGRYVTSRCDGSRLLGDGLTSDEAAILGPGRPVTTETGQ